MYSMRGKEMFDYLPWYYGKSRIMQSILDSQGTEIDAARTALEESLKQFYADTADWSIEYWEKELGITPPQNADIGLRRALVKAKLTWPTVMTPKQIETIANYFVPSHNAQVIEVPMEYAFILRLPADLLWHMELKQAVNEAKPAHLMLKECFFVSTLIKHDQHVQQVLTNRTFTRFWNKDASKDYRWNGCYKFDGTINFSNPGMQLEQKHEVKIYPVLRDIKPFTEVKQCWNGAFLFDGTRTFGDFIPNGKLCNNSIKLCSIKNGIEQEVTLL